MKLKTETNEQSMCGRTKIHNVKFYNITPRSIKCMSYYKIDHKLALARNDGSIEIWDMEYSPYLQKSTPRLSPELSVESIVWAGKRLFTAGFSGEVIEWNTLLMEPRWQHRVTGNAIWCLAVNKQCTELAIGTEEGYINIFNIENDELQYKLLYDKQEGRVLCCCFDETGNHLVTGSVEVLRIWNARTGHALNKMTLPKSVNNQETIIWTLQVLRDFSIIAGDSRGYITVYDGNNGAHLEAHQVLKADVLALHVNEEEDMLVCSGVESIIRIYAKTKIKREDNTFYRWIKYLQRAVHDHDVKSLICASGERIISGGVDGYLGISSITRMKSNVSRHGPFLLHPFATIANVAQLLLLRYPNFLEIWHLGTPKTDTILHNLNIDDEDSNLKKANTINEKIFALETSPLKLLELKSKNDEPIACASLSADGQWLCYSTIREMRLFRFLPRDVALKNPSQIRRCKNKSLENISFTHVSFSNDSNNLYVVTRATTELLIFVISSRDEVNNLKLIESIDLSKQLKGTITFLTISESGRIIAIADDKHTIAVWSLSKAKNFTHRLNLPRYETAATTAIAVHPNLSRIVATFADNRIVEYDLDKACFTCWFDGAYIVPNTETHCITQILLDARNPDVVLLQNDGYLFVLEKYMPSDSEDLNDSHDNTNNVKNSNKKSKITNTTVGDKSRKMLSLRLKFQKPYEHLVHTSWLSKDELVTVKVNRIFLLEQLPAAFRQKKYGTT